MEEGMQYNTSSLATENGIYSNARAEVLDKRLKDLGLVEKTGVNNTRGTGSSYALNDPVPSDVDSFEGRVALTHAVREVINKLQAEGATEVSSQTVVDALNASGTKVTKAQRGDVGSILSYFASMGNLARIEDFVEGRVHTRATITQKGVFIKENLFMRLKHLLEGDASTIRLISQMVGNVEMHADEHIKISADAYYPISLAHAQKEAESRKAELLSYITINPGQDNTAIAKALGLSRDTVRDYLFKLQKKGTLHSIMSFKNHNLVGWHITNGSKEEN